LVGIPVELAISFLETQSRGSTVGTFQNAPHYPHLLTPNTGIGNGIFQPWPPNHTPPQLKIKGQKKVTMDETIVVAFWIGENFKM
jgi:hypothetical protein